MNPDVFQMLLKADEFIANNDFVSAKNLLTKILVEHDNESIDAANRLAFVDIKSGNYENAADLLKQIIKVDPANETALENILSLKNILEKKIQTNSGLSIIIPVFNKCELTINCLKSLIHLGNDIPFEVIIVDNASTDNTNIAVAELNKNLPFEIKYLRNELNYGFARANNIGASHASFDTLLFLNNDTVALNDFISKPMELLNQNGVGLVGIKLIYPDKLIQHAGLAFSKKKNATHIFKFYPLDYPAANISREMQAVTGAAMFIKKKLFARLNGFDEVYINGHEDVDLCFRVREEGLKVWYCSDSFIVHLESQSANRFEKSIQNREIFLKRWADKIITDEDNYYIELKNRSFFQLIKNKFDLPSKINFAIKIGVPSREEKNWGDIFYAESLAKALRNHGHNCVIHYLDEWNLNDKNIHVVIHLKGLSRYILKKHNINILWIINHPELHSPEEINSYDLVFSASEKYFKRMKHLISAPFFYLPQATDVNIFKPAKKVEEEIDILFIGNNYEFKNNRCRKIIDDLKSLNKEYNLKIIGDHWEGYVDSKFIAGKFVEWKLLPQYYQKAKIVLNDHQETMRDEGFINNRTFDIAASGAFQISNNVEGLSKLGIITYTDATDLCSKIDFYLQHDEERKKIINNNIKLAETYNFDKRANEILSHLKILCNQELTYNLNVEKRVDHSLEMTKINCLKKDPASSIPEICVLMTTYNRQGIIANAIQSVIDQTFSDWNLIIVNDGGEDISELIQTFNDDRIKYFNISHKGKSAALNFAIANSQSKYIAYLDDDDRYHPNHLETLHSYLIQHPESEFVYSASEEVQLFNHNGVWLEKDRYTRYAIQIQPHQMRLMNHIPNLCVMHTRSLFEKAGMYDEELIVLIDWDMYRRFVLHTSPVFLNQVTCEYNRKIIPGKTFAHNQMTGVYYQDSCEYYKNRLRILNKDFNIPNFKGENAVIIYLQNQTPETIIAAAEKIADAKKSIHFQPIFIIDVPLTSSLVDAIRQAEQFVFLFQWNDSGIVKDEFLKNIISKKVWQKYIIFDEIKAIDKNVICNAFNQNLRVINLSKSFNKHFESTKLRVIPNLVSIIIPTFNKWKLTKKCLDSICKHTPHHLNYELIIVDNASTDETRKELKRYEKKFPVFKVLLNDDNLGFAKANNLGAANADGKYLLLLNNDTEVSPGWLENLRSVLDNDDTVGAAGSKLLFPDNTIQHAGVVILNDKRKEINDPLVARHVRWKEHADEPDTNTKRTYQALTAACLMIRKKAFDEAGGFDENFWNGYEDVDLCFRLGAMGFKLVYQPESVLIHYESQSGPERFARAQENIKLLHDRWLGKIIPDYFVDENGKICPSGNNKIWDYFPPLIKKKKVSIITLTYNQLEYTKKFVESLFKYSGNDFELIVIDNASTDGTKNYLNQLQKKYVNVKVVFNDDNAGFPAAVNQGILQAAADYLLIANNDIIVTDGWLDRMIEVIESDKSIGLVGPISNSVSGVQLDKEAAYSTLDEMQVYAYKNKVKNKNKTFCFPRLAFLCTLIRKEVIEKIGGLDERFSPGNFEDDDFCLRAQLAGFKAAVAQDVFIHHFGSKSFTADGVENYQRRLEINKNIFVKKWGADPEEIWLHGNDVIKRELFYPINYNSLLQAFERLQLHTRENEYELAVIEFNKALNLFDKNAISEISLNESELYNIGGWLFLHTNDLGKSRHYFELALNSNPHSSDACTGLGELFFKEGNYESAKIMFEWGVKHNPVNKFAAAGIQKCKSILHSSVDAAVSITESEIAVQLEDVKKLIEKKQFEEALQQLSYIESITRTNDMKLNSAIATLKGFSSLGLNKLNEARNHFERALYDEPESSDACAGLAEIFYLSGYHSEARTMFEWAVKYNAANKFAALRLEQLNSAVSQGN